METNKVQQEEKLTEAQFRALHKLFGDTAKELRDNGITMKAILARFSLEVPATKNSVKELWKILQENMFGTNSTKLLLKQQEINMIYDSLNKFFGQEFKISLPPFPSQEEVRYLQESKKVK